jgi:hypothetical protein
MGSSKVFVLTDRPIFRVIRDRVISFPNRPRWTCRWSDRAIASATPEQARTPPAPNSGA